MPRLTVYMVRAALLYFGVGFTFGALILWHKGAPFEAQTWRLLYPHVEFILFGWTFQLALGVAYWILPRFPGQHRYGRARLAWVGFALFNPGVLLTAFSAWQGDTWAAGTLAGYALKLAGVVVLAVVMWPRIKPIAQEPTPLWKLIKAARQPASAAPPTDTV